MSIIECNNQYPYTIKRSDWVLNGSNTRFALSFIPELGEIELTLNAATIPYSIDGQDLLTGVIPDPTDELIAFYEPYSGVTLNRCVYPNFIRGLGFSVQRRPEFSTIIHTSPSFSETAISQSKNPRWHYGLQYNYLKNDPSDLITGIDYSDYQSLLSFFLAHYGQGSDFLFNDEQTPDNYIGPALINGDPNPLVALQLIQHSLTNIWYSPIQKAHARLFYEDIADLRTLPDVYANGVLQTLGVDYSIGGSGLSMPGYSFAGKYLQWYSEPTTPITIDVYFYRRVRYDMDEWETEKFMQFLWGGGGSNGGDAVKLVTKKRYQL